MKITLLLMVASVLVSCDTPFNSDLLDPRLPIYSETGVDVAGALLDNGEVWTMLEECGGLFCDDDSEFRISLEDSVLRILMRGGVYDESGKKSERDREITFEIYGDFQEEGDLVKLSNTTYNFNSDSSRVIYRELGNREITECVNNSGQVHFRHVGFRSSPKKGVIIAGTFGIINEDNSCGFAKIRQGRFDLHYMYR